MSEDLWEVYAFRYAERLNRIRSDSFILDVNPNEPHPLDYYIWLLRSGRQTIVVDTGFDEAEAARRGLQLLHSPADQLRAFGVDAGTVETVIVTHLHHDHAGALHRFPKGTLHVQADEMAYATGPCMCHAALRMPFSAEHVVTLVRRLYAGDVVFHQGDGSVAPGVTVHRIGGHSRGLQCVRVKTRMGWVVLASDASHFYENFLTEKPFPIVVDVEAMLSGYSRIRNLASMAEFCVPGHDPLVRSVFPKVDGAPGAFRIDVKPLIQVKASI